MNRIKTTLALIGIALGLAACATEYRFTPPNHVEGQRCIASCGVKQDVCREKEAIQTAEHNHRCKIRDEAEKTQCEHDADVDYAACLKYSDDKRKERCKRKICHVHSCARSVQTEGCASDYRICFQVCGGTVSILE